MIPDGRTSIGRGWPSICSEKQSCSSRVPDSNSSLVAIWAPPALRLRDEALDRRLVEIEPVAGRKGDPQAGEYAFVFVE